MHWEQTMWQKKISPELPWNYNCHQPDLQTINDKEPQNGTLTPFMGPVFVQKNSQNSCQKLSKKVATCYDPLPFSLLLPLDPLHCFYFLKTRLAWPRRQDQTTLAQIMTSHIPFLSIPEEGEWVQVRPIVWHCLALFGQLLSVFKESHLQGRQLSSILVFPPDRKRHV